MKRIFFVLLIFMLAGCATVNIKPVPRVYDKRETFKLGEIQEKTIGEEMLFRQDIIGEPLFVVQYEYQPPSEMGVVFPAIKQGMKWVVRGVLENGDYVCWSGIYDTYYGDYYPTIAGQPAIDTPWYLMVSKDHSAYGIMNMGGYIFKWPVQQKNFVKSDMLALKGSFREVLIYNGKTQNTIKIQYRESKDDFARPAFYQDLTYDLSESKTIGFKGMLIDVLEATNSKIKFIVKSEMTK